MSSGALAPCQICGASVVERTVPGDQRLGGVSSPPTVKRICTSRECPSNTGVGLQLTQAV